MWIQNHYGGELIQVALEVETAAGAAPVAAPAAAVRVLKMSELPALKLPHRVRAYLPVADC